MYTILVKLGSILIFKLIAERTKIILKVTHSPSTLSWFRSARATRTPCSFTNETCKCQYRSFVGATCRLSQLIENILPLAPSAKVASRIHRKQEEIVPPSLNLLFSPKLLSTNSSTLHLRHLRLDLLRAGRCIVTSSQTSGLISTIRRGERA